MKGWAFNFIRMAYGQLKAPTNIRIDFKPSPRQYELWKLLQPDYCPHCGGHIIQVKSGYDQQGNPKFVPQCDTCGTQDLPQLILGGGAAGKLHPLPAFTVTCRKIAL